MEALGDGKAGQDEKREQKKKKQVNFSGNFEEDDDDKRCAYLVAEAVLCCCECKQPQCSFQCSPLNVSCFHLFNLCNQNSLDHLTSTRTHLSAPCHS